MPAAIHPTQHAARVDRRRTRVLRRILNSGLGPILHETGRFILCAARVQGGSGLELGEIEVLETHSFVGPHIRVADASRACVVARAEFLGFGLRTDRNTADGNTAICELLVELAQLRERLGEEASTNVAQPDDERRQRNRELENGSRSDIADLL